MSGSNSIGICMIVKNEEEYLAACLDSVKEIVEEIVIVDTGSTDQTIQIASEYGAQVYRYPWNNEFSGPRNYGLKKMTTDWILLLDADECLEPTTLTLLKETIHSQKEEGYRFLVKNYIEKNNKEVYSTHTPVRLIRNGKGYYYKGSIHEQLTKPGWEDKECEFTAIAVIVHHYGYIKEVIDKKKKRERNQTLIEKELEKAPTDSYYLYLLGNEYMARKEYGKAYAYYIKAFQNKNEIAQHKQYLPQLYFHIISCLIQKKDYPQAVNYADEALIQYPECNDYRYLKLLVYLEDPMEYGKEKEIIRLYKQWFEAKEAPVHLRFLKDLPRNKEK